MYARIPPRLVGAACALLPMSLLVLPVGCGDDPADEEPEVSEAFSKLMENSPTYDKSTIDNALPKRDFSKVARGAYFDGLAAFLYGYPAVLMYAGLYGTMIDKSVSGMGEFNKLYHADRLARPEDKHIPTPNNDTLYSSAWLDLNTEPVVLTVPKMDKRYYSFQLMDFYTSTFDYVGSRKTGSDAGSFIIAGPKWVGLAKGLKVLRAPTPHVWMLVRTLVDGPSDLTACLGQMKQYKLQPLSAFRGTKAPPSRTPVYPKPPVQDSKENLDFYRAMGHALKLNPPLLRDRWLTAFFHLVGFKADWTFDPSRLSERRKQALRYAVDDGLKLLKKLTTMPGKTVNGWSTSPKGVGTYGVNYPLRAAVAYKGLGALPEEEASYTTANVDGSDKAMTGASKYQLVFPKDKLPPAKAFWSVTMYDFATMLLVDNPLKRYSLGDRSGVTKEADGSLIIHMQHAQPAGGTANWLPTPKGRFYVVLRLYNPSDDYLKGTYKVPGIKLVK